MTLPLQDIYIACGILVFAYMLFWFTLANVKKDNGIADIAWGLGFVLIAFFTLVKYSDFLPRQVLLTTLVFIWGLRLATYIFFRGLNKPEDFRYANWRKKWGNFAIIRAFFQVFMLQGFFMLLISLPIIHVNTFNTYIEINNWDIVGCLVFLFGLVFESVADWQLLLFKRKKSSKGKIMTTGLWKYSRHPNYFGECVLWWGIFIIATQAHFVQSSLIGPILINFLILFVSGIPMLERKYAKNNAFQAYAKKTSVFFPMLPKK